MKGFIHNLVSNQINEKGKVLPRIKGRFESLSEHQHITGNEINEENNPVNEHFADHSFSNNSTQLLNFQLNKNNNNVSEKHIDGYDPASSFKKNNKTTTPSNIQHSENGFNEIDEEKEASRSHLLAERSEQLRSLTDHSLNSNDEDNSYDGRNMLNSLSNGELNLLTNRNLHIENNDERNYGDQLMHNDDNNINAKELLTSNSIKFNEQLQANTAFLNALAGQNNSNDNRSSSAKEAASVVKINIGRIDVRAVTSANTVRESSKPKQRITFDDFLNQKNGSK